GRRPTLSTLGVLGRDERKRQQRAQIRLGDDLRREPHVRQALVVRVRRRRSAPVLGCLRQVASRARMRQRLTMPRSPQLDHGPRSALLLPTSTLLVLPVRFFFFFVVFFFVNFLVRRRIRADTPVRLPRLVSVYARISNHGRSHAPIAALM